jgi:hypothetical protein
MTQANAVRKLVFKTTKIGDKIYCGIRDGVPYLLHKTSKERKGHGHDPGYVYLAYLPKGKYKGLYKIGKVEYTKVGTDDFILNRKLEMKLLEALQKRFGNYHPGIGSDEVYDGAQFVHGIRVACGEGAEKQPHSFFKPNKLPQVDRELYSLTETEIEAFKTATGQVLGRRIKHLTAKEFSDYLAKYGFSEKAIWEWVVLPRPETKDEQNHV